MSETTILLTWIFQELDEHPTSLYHLQPSGTDAFFLLPELPRPYHRLMCLHPATDGLGSHHIIVPAAAT